MAQTKEDVFVNRQVRKECILLKDHPNPTLFRRHKHTPIGHNLAADFDHPGVRPLETGNQTQRRRLATAARTQQRQTLPFLQLSTQVINRRQRLGRTSDLFKREETHRTSCIARLS
jgi:hypothetical protein